MERRKNPFSVYPDPAAEEFDYSDMKYCFVTDDVDRQAFEEEHPEAYCGSGEFSGLSDKQRDEWFPKGAVRIEVSYFPPRDATCVADGDVCTFDSATWNFSRRRSASRRLAGRRGRVPNSGLCSGWAHEASRRLGPTLSAFASDPRRAVCVSEEVRGLIGRWRSSRLE